MKLFEDYVIRSPNLVDKSLHKVTITKKDEEKQYVFGWAKVAITVDGEQLVDRQEDLVDPEELEETAYRFVEFYREAGEMHERGDIGVLIESIVFTAEKMRAMGIPEGTLPEGWWIGFHITDEDVWEKVKDGTYSMFSIEGRARRVPVEEKGEEEPRNGF